MLAISDIFPTSYQLRVNQQTVEVHIVLNWLDIEVDRDAEKKMPALENISGYRNREVRAHLVARDFYFTPEKIAAMYGVNL